ncbi:bacteriohemerythrin [Bacillus rubiinfantis]|uniref:bacteriohemerythrin n=1 Tax=Bacillus rubiinfantis TaxID=1499680 RepID=UPI0005A96DCA|nr:bacteriohemerythrin [Bacillus rubiinfantis]
MFKWKEEYKTGNTLVDEQHKKLFAIGDSAYELLKNDGYLDKYDKIVDTIQELKDYTVYHFRAEEEYMLKSGFKGFFAHKVEHDDFIEKFENIDYSRIDDGQNEYILGILNFIADWITQHIIVKDQQHSHK